MHSTHSDLNTETTSMSQEEAQQHPQHCRQHHHYPYITNHDGHPSVHLQQQELHSNLLCMNYSFDYGYSSSSCCSPSIERVRDMMSAEQMATNVSIGAGKNTSSHKKRICPAQKVRRRQAANTRERRRMQSISDAFEGLRAYIPIPAHDKNVTKVDTLRLAIRYIGFLSNLVLSDIYSQERSHPPEETQKVIILCPNSTQGNFVDPGSPPPSAHSLSWSAINRPSLGPAKKTLVAKVWTPEDPRTHSRSAEHY